MDSIQRILRKTKNSDLKRLLTENDVATKIDNGYRVSGVFVSNVAANDQANDYLANAATDGHQIDLWDMTRLGPVLKQLSHEWLVDSEVKLRVNPNKIFHEGLKSKPDLVFAAVSAVELVKIPGIEDTRVFAQNVRLDLGRTRVNRDIASTVDQTSEHKRFLTFHNGLTVVAKDIKVARGIITLNNYSICNGCQSLRTFFKSRDQLTRALEILVRVVRVGDERKIAELIAYRTNNQNPISLRDLSANDATQLQLKNDFQDRYGHDTSYLIKGGEPATGRELPNEAAGQLLLSLYVGEPWSAHQKYKIFGENRRRIFAYGTTAAKIRLAQLMRDVVQESMSGLGNQRIERYTLTRYIALYLLGEVL